MVPAQPNRTAKLSSRFLNVYDAAWSGAAENSAALFLALQAVDPSTTEWEDNRFPVHSKDGGLRYFIIAWKSRDGWPLQSGHGAIRIEADANGQYKKLWVGDVYQNKLHKPNSQTQFKKVGYSKKGE